MRALLQERVVIPVRRAPGWVLAVGIYLLARGFSTVVTLWFAARQPENLWTVAGPGYGDFVSMWDGDRYRRIAEHGYPMPFPLDPLTGEPRQSEWAFFPAYPALVRLVMLTGLPFTTVAPALSLLLGAVAVIGLHLLFEDLVGRSRALISVAAVSCFPTAAVLGYSYSEATALAALAWGLLLAHRGRYLAAVVPAVVLSLCRPVGLAFGLMLLVLLVVRHRAARAGRSTPGGLPGLLTLGVCTGLAALTFPAVVGWVSGMPDGYTRLQVAWRVQDHMEYVTPWLWMSRYLFGPVWGLVAVAVLAAAVTAALASPRMRRLGPVVWGWTFAYVVYLVAVVDPFTSVFRFLLLLAPAAPALFGRRPAWWSVVLLLGALSVLQVIWIGTLWSFSPPSDFPP